MDTLQNISLPASLIEEAKAATGLRSPRAAFKALLDLKRIPALVRESEIEFRTGKARRFRSSKAAMKWLES